MMKMKDLLLLVVVYAILSYSCLFYSPISSFSTSTKLIDLKKQSAASSSSTSTSSSIILQAAAASEAERLLERARQLRKEAEEEEHKIHKEQHEKIKARNEQLDGWITDLFISSSGTEEEEEELIKVSNIVNKLHEKCPCIDTLESIVDRLHERRLHALGIEHVDFVNNSSTSNSSSSVHKRVKSTVNENVANEMEQYIESLIKAASVLDEEFNNNQKNQNDKVVTAATGTTQQQQQQHWGGNERSKILNNRWHELNREYEEQYQKRQESFYEAQRIKKNHKPPPKVKDDHGLIP